MVKNKLGERFTTYGYYSYYALYLLLIIIAVDNNSYIELIVKTGISFAFLFFLNKNEVIKIFFIFYFLFFIFYFLFFIFYFLADDENSKHLANAFYIISFFIFPGYVLAYFVILLTDRTKLLTNIFFNVAILISFVMPHFGYRSGIADMTYTPIDIFVFILIIIQLIVHLYKHFKLKT